MLHLRPHHLLCIQNYIGKGYDENFTKKMNQVTVCLENDPGQEILLEERCDDLCSVCPNQRDGRCSSLDRVERLDRLTAQACNINNGEILPWRMAAAKAKEKILNTAAFQQICKECSWFELCREIVSNNNK